MNTDTHRFDVGQILQQALDSLPAGRWGVGVSGGADSTALLRLLAMRKDLQLVVIHLNHETRGEESDADERFVCDLAQSLGLCFRSARLGQIELISPPTNASAKYRLARLTWFREVVDRENLAGVVLAHHADDQAETILHRLLRGGSFAVLGGMQPVTTISGLCIHRPLLRVDRAILRECLHLMGQNWREDSSNLNPAYTRNVHRRVLENRRALRDALIHAGEAMTTLRQWVQSASPDLPAVFPAVQLSRLPEILAHESARRWLRCAGCDEGQMTSAVIDQLMEMARDAAVAARQHFPGGVLVQRKSGWITCARAASTPSESGS